MTQRRDAPLLFVRLLNERDEPVRVASDEILSFEYHDSDRKADLVKLTVDNATLLNFDDPAWRKGAKIDVRWGYHGNMAPARRAVITTVKGFSELSIEARAESVLMNREPKTRVFENATRSEVVRQIASENGYSGDVIDIDDTEERFEVITQPRLTDAQMIRRLAAREGFEFFVDHDGFHWHARRLAQRPIRTFRYFTDQHGEIIGEPTIDNDVTAKPGRVRVRGRDPLTREDINAVADNETDADRPGLGGILDIFGLDEGSAVGGGSVVTQEDSDFDEIDFETGTTTTIHNSAQEEVRPSSAASEAEATAEARGRFRRAQQTAIKMKLTVIGDPNLLAKTVCQIEGMGRRLSVRYYIAEVRHTLSDSYTCELTLVSDGHGGHDTTSRAAAGLDLLEVGPATRARQNGEEAPEPNGTDAGDGEEPGDLFAVDVIDRETGETVTEWRRTPSRGRNET